MTMFCSVLRTHVFMPAICIFGVVSCSLCMFCTLVVVEFWSCRVVVYLAGDRSLRVVLSSEFSEFISIFHFLLSVTIV